MSADYFVCVAGPGGVDSIGDMQSISCMAVVVRPWTRPGGAGGGQGAETQGAFG